MDDATLNEWAAQARTGDERSFRRLVDALTRTLIAAAYRYTHDWESARDLTQDTWIRVHRGIHRWDPRRPFAPWLHALHRNGCLDHLRRPWVRRESATGPDALAGLSGQAPDDPSADAEWHEFRDRVLRAARELSESQRRIFLRVDLEQADRAEVARELGIAPGTLRSALHFARRHIARALTPPEEESA